MDRAEVVAIRTADHRLALVGHRKSGYGGHVPKNVYFDRPRIPAPIHHDTVHGSNALIGKTLGSAGGSNPQRNKKMPSNTTSNVIFEHDHPAQATLLDTSAKHRSSGGGGGSTNGPVGEGTLKQRAHAQSALASLSHPATAPCGPHASPALLLGTIDGRIYSSHGDDAFLNRTATRRLSNTEAAAAAAASRIMGGGGAATGSFASSISPPRSSVRRFHRSVSASVARESTVHTPASGGAYMSSEDVREAAAAAAGTTPQHLSQPAFFGRQCSPPRHLASPTSAAIAPHFAPSHTVSVNKGAVVSSGGLAQVMLPARVRHEGASGVCSGTSPASQYGPYLNPEHREAMHHAKQRAIVRAHSGPQAQATRRSGGPGTACEVDVIDHLAQYVAGPDATSHAIDRSIPSASSAHKPKMTPFPRYPILRGPNRLGPRGLESFLSN